MSDENSEKLVLVPRLRFPEFRGTGAWEEETLGAVCDMQAGKFVAASEISEKKADGLYPCFGGNGLRGYTKTYNQSGRYSLIGRQGALCGNVNLVDGDFYATEHAVVTTPKAGNSTDWLFYTLCLLNLNRFATGQAQPGLSVEMLEKVACVVPKDKDEQQKIADCLSSLDELITAEIQKLDALKTHKNGLMQQLFPREGETVPRLRFPEFREAGEWEDRSLESISNGISSGKDTSDPEGLYDLYGSTGVIGKTSTASCCGEFILVARVGANAGLLTKSVGEFGVTDNTLVIRLDNAVNLDFVFHYLDNTGLNKLIFGSGQPLITGGQLKALPVYFPSDTEQRKIADCLSALDDLILAQSQKIESLKTHKKGLMQQLFPVLDEEQK